MFREQEKRLAVGDECWAMWGRGRAAENDHEFNFGSRLGTYVDVALTRIDDRAGFHSKAATRRLLAKLDEVDPDVVHLHNLHGYYLNIEMLFQWLAKRNQMTFWTLHDCWSFTGHCSHFTYVKCEQWKTHCSYEYKCPQKSEYPKSCLFDNSKRNFDDKRCIFTSLSTDKQTIITPSKWLARLVSQSFLSKYPIEVRHNDVDHAVFKPTPSEFRAHYGIDDRFMVLGVASPWTERKGINDFMRLARDFEGRLVIVLVGLRRNQIESLPQGIIGIERTESRKELATIYSAADVLFNPTREDNYPSVNLESEACGTPVLTYDTGGCSETIGAMHDSKVIDDYEAAARMIADMIGEWQWG